jgi:hypothetical protein
MMKRFLVTIPFLFLPLSGFTDEFEGGCKMKCHEKEVSERNSCRDERRQCVQKNFDSRFAKMSESGIPAEKKAKMIEKMTKRIEMMKAHAEDMNDSVQLMEQNLNKVKTIKEKSPKK